jgi:hypothetical protein
MNMTKNVLLLGRREAVIDDVKRHLDLADIQLIGETGLDDVRSAFARASIDHVIMGAGIDLETRLQIVHEVFQLSDSTTVHMKDRTTGPQGFRPFVRSVLGGLESYEFRPTGPADDAHVNS